MILVTGGTGLVGSHLLFHLAQREDKIRAICRSGSDLQKVKNVFAYYISEPESLFKKIEWVEASLNDIPELKRLFTGSPMFIIVLQWFPLIRKIITSCEK